LIYIIFRHSDRKFLHNIGGNKTNSQKLGKELSYDIELHEVIDYQSNAELMVIGHQTRTPGHTILQAVVA